MHMLTIGKHIIGGGNPAFIIAEAGVNHNGDVSRAHDLIDAAADAGADAVKFQTFSPRMIAAPEAERAAYQIAAMDEGGSQLDMLEKLVLPAEAYPGLMQHADERGLVFLSTPFDAGSADFLDELGLPAFKVSSGDVTNTPFLEFLAAKGKPILLSTGMADFDEVSRAVAAIDPTPLALFHCVSNYPSAPHHSNLHVMATLRENFACPVGWSDHTQGLTVTIAAAALGAELLEKHFTLDRNLPGPDHQASLEPDELRAMVAAVRDAEISLGDGIKRPVAEEEPVAKVARRSLYWAQDLAAGTVIADEHLMALRPGTGISPEKQRDLIGRKVARDVVGMVMVAEGDFSSPPGPLSIS
jgi:N-acetylneuraminate synthase/N,N'-diacetyllegionaminate synthase